jgi:hypothetical protein
MNTSHSSSTDSVFILPLIPLIDNPTGPAEPQDEELATMSAGSDSDLDGSPVEAMD